jgi:hypothetical protein
MTPAQYNEYERQAQVIERHEKWKEQQNKAEISDEEIEKAAENYGWRIKTNTFSDPVKANELAQSAKQDFMEGAKWYRKQLKNIDKKL